MGKTKVNRCTAAGCRTLTAGDLCKSHQAPPPPAPLEGLAAQLLERTRAELESRAAARRAAELEETRAQHALQREQLHFMGRQGDDRQPVFLERGDGI